MTRARKLASWPLLGVVLVVSVAFGLSSVRTRAAAEEAVEVGASEGAITPAPPITEIARPVVKRPGIGTSTRTVGRTEMNDLRAPHATVPPRKSAAPAAVEPAADPKIPGAASARDEKPGAGAESLAGVGLKLLLGSLVLAGLLYGASRWLKRLPLARFLPGTDGPIKVIGRTHLGPKASLCLVEVGSTTLLVSMTGTTIQTLHVWPDGATGASGADRQGFKAPTAPAAPAPGQLRHLESRLTGRNG